jgi:uncharacterized membrane protein HdeD (DUF308 family)
MSDEAPRGAWRMIVGRPRVWQGVVWTLIGVLWLVLAVLGSETWRWVIGDIWIVLGVLQLTVAASDRRHRRGRYAAPPLTVQAPARPADSTAPLRR